MYVDRITIYAYVSVAMIQELAFAQQGEGHPMKVMPMTLAMSSSGECSTTDEDAGHNQRVEARGRHCHKAHLGYRCC